jgi:hypothetical protein
MFSNFKLENLEKIQGGCGNSSCYQGNWSVLYLKIFSRLPLQNDSVPDIYVLQGF